MTNVQEAFKLYQAMSPEDRNRFTTLCNNYTKLSRRQAELEVKATLQVGSRVQIAYSIRPQYLGGAKATVTAIGVGKVSIRLDEGQHWGKFINGELRIPASALKAIE